MPYQRDADEVKAMAYRILIVEKEWDTRELLDLTLRLSGHSVDVASNLSLKITQAVSRWSMDA